VVHRQKGNCIYYTSYWENYEKVAQGDGSKVEKKSKSVKVDISFLGSINTSV
jgi:hypothetical protein